MLKFDIITLFPESIEPYAAASILGRAQKKKLIEITAHNLRSFSKDKHCNVDDTPYGGGAGMVMTVQPIDSAVQKIKKRSRKINPLQLPLKNGKGRKNKSRVIMTAASGKKFTQSDAKRLAKYDQLIFICGRYEGIDERIRTAIADETFSIGDYVLTGGELPALVMTDAIARNVPGVLGSIESLKEESHGDDGTLEYPQYTKPEEYTYKVGLRKKKLTVPKVLLSGNHAKIKEWRKEQSKKRSE